MEATRPNPYDSIRLENQLCFPLYACAKEIVRQYRTPLEPLGLTYTQYVVMMVLWECGSITEKELGEKIHLDSGTLAPLLKRLDKQGLVKRGRPDRDERLLQITLTDAGIALQEEALSVPETMKNCIGLSMEEYLMVIAAFCSVASFCSASTEITFFPHSGCIDLIAGIR